MGNFAKFDDRVGREDSELAVVVAFDPGETTGFAVLGVEPHMCDGGGWPDSMNWPKLDVDSIAHIEYGEIDCGARHGETGMGMLRGHSGLNLAGESAGIDRMVLMLRYYHKPVIVFEDFIVDFNKITMSRSALSPVRVTAAFSYAHRAKLQSMFVQNRSPVKTTCTDDRLKTWGLYDSHSGPHARDAIRHAFYFLRTCRGNGKDAQEKRWLAWPHLFPDPFSKEDQKSKRAPKPPGERINRLG